MSVDPKIDKRKFPASVEDESEPAEQTEVLDPNDTNSLRERIRGQTEQHAVPPRLEDEGQSGG